MSGLPVDLTRLTAAAQARASAAIGTNMKASYLISDIDLGATRQSPNDLDVGSSREARCLKEGLYALLLRFRSAAQLTAPGEEKPGAKQAWKDSHLLPLLAVALGSLRT